MRKQQREGRNDERLTTLLTTREYVFNPINYLFQITNYVFFLSQEFTKAIIDSVHCRVSSNVDLPDQYSTLVDRGVLSNVNGEYRFQDTGTIVTLDILTLVVDTLTFENLVPHRVHIGEIGLPSLEYASAIKIKCFYLRADEIKKRDGDIIDIRFICAIMEQRSQKISNECAKDFQFGFYHILELRQELSSSDIENFIQIEGRKLILPWEQNSVDQQEYFTCFAEAGTDPLTVRKSVV